MNATRKNNEHHVKTLKPICINDRTCWFWLTLVSLYFGEIAKQQAIQNTFCLKIEYVRHEKENEEIPNLQFNEEINNILL